MAYQAKDLPKFEDFQFPTYEVITPHSKLHLTVRSLTVAQEERLRESALTAAKATALLNQTVYECITEKEPPLDTIYNFERNVSIIDREALLYGILVASYGEEQDFTINCSACDFQYTVKENITENVDIRLYEGRESLIAKTVDVTLPISKYKAVLCLPTLKDEREFATSKGISQEILRRADSYIIIRELHIPQKQIVTKQKPEENIENESSTNNSEDDKKYLVVKNVFEIYSYLRNLPSRDKIAIRKAWNEAYGNYGINLYVRGTCPNCGKSEENPVSLIAELFRLSQ